MEYAYALQNKMNTVQMKNREAVMLEALVRWTHASLGEISPGEFVPLAEKT